MERRRSKSKWRSKTIWFNIGTFLVSLGTQFVFLEQVLPVEYQLIATIVLATLVALGNVVLRMVTKEPLE